MIPPAFLLNFNISKRVQYIKQYVLCPIIESNEHIKQIENINTFDENRITRNIYRYVKEESSISRQIGRHFILIHYRAKDVIDDKEVEPDLELTLPGCFRINFEAKRIYSKGYAEYCGKDGLECFLNGYYSREDEIGGMLAYVQRSDVFSVKKELIKRVKNKGCIDLIDDFFIESSFLSVHKRIELGNKIDIYHLLLDLS